MQKKEHKKSIELRAVVVRDNKKSYSIVPENGDIGYLIIRGVFLDKTTSGKLNELSFIPAHKALLGIIIPLSSLKESECATDMHHNIFKNENTNNDNS